MRILVDINHPHHVHLFRNAIQIWRNRGDEVLITAREKDITTRLLDLYGLNYQLTGRQRIPSSGNFVLGVVESDIAVFRAAKGFNPDFLIGTSFAVAHVSKLVRGQSMVFGEDDVNTSRLFWFITIPFADYIVTPDTLGEDFGKKHITYPGWHELAYLHPNHFTPNPNVLIEQGMEIDEPFCIVRFVSLRASHDVGERGLSEETKDKLIDIMLEKGRVIISSEEKPPTKYSEFQLRVSPDKLHHLLAFAQLLVSDSQTMTIEAAVLGTPSIRCNTFVGRTPVIEELEKKYELTFGFSPDNEKAMLRKTKEILASPISQQPWKIRQKHLLDEKIDLTSWMVELLEKAGKGEL